MPDLYKNIVDLNKAIKEIELNIEFNPDNPFEILWRHDNQTIPITVTTVLANKLKQDFARRWLKLAKQERDFLVKELKKTL